MELDCQDNVKRTGIIIDMYIIRLNLCRIARERQMYIMLKS